MHTQSTTLPGRHDHPPQAIPSTASRPVRRVGWLDRTALHLGVALIKWGRRRGRVLDPEQATLAHQAYLAREESERLRTQREAMYLTRIL